MNRRHIFCLLLALLTASALPTTASAANAWLSLNLQFNTLGNFNSGGTWTAVGKAEPQGFAGIVLDLKNTNVGTYLTPPQFDVHQQAGNTSVRQIVLGSSLTLPYPIGIGVIGGPFPSTYVDPAGLIPFGGYPSYGSFTGGVALATGTFPAGVVPDWIPQGGSLSPVNLFTGPSPAPVVNVNTMLTVRYVVPEPGTCLMAIAGAVIFGTMVRLQR